MNPGIKILNVYPGNEKQENAGIYANVRLAIVTNDDQVIMTLNDLTLRKSREGNFFLSAPSREYKNKQGEKAWASYFKLFPLGQDGTSDDDQRTRMKDLTDHVVREYQNAKNNSQGSSSQAQTQEQTTSTRPAW